MATLAEAVDAAETDWLVSADIPDTVDYLTVESEVVQVTATFPAQYQARDGTTSEPRIRVVRGAGGTTAASHADTTALTPLIPPSASGGGAAEAGTVVVTDPPDDIEDALTGADTPSAGNPYMTQSAVDLGTVLAAGNDANTLPIIGLGDPTDPQDAATKAYVDGDGVPTLDTVLAAGNSVNGEDGEDADGSLVAKDAGVIRSALSLTKTGAASISIKDALGVEVASLAFSENELLISVDDGAQSLTMSNGTGLSYAGPTGTLAITPGGEVSITGTTFRLIGLPTSAGAAGELWNDTGVVTVA